MNIEQMTQKTREALQAAQRIAVEYSNNAVEQEHLLAAQGVRQRVDLFVFVSGVCGEDEVRA